MTRGRRVVAVVALLAVMVLAGAGCGRFQLASDRPDPTTTGAITTLPPLATTTTTRFQQAGPATAPPTRPPADPCAAAPTSTIDDASGFRLTVTAGTRACYGARDDFTLTLRVENRSGQPLRYDGAQDTFFDVIPQDNPAAGSWSDASCRRREPGGPSGGAVSLAPGASVGRASAVYPAAPAQPNREDCRILDGTYSVVATFRWCPAACTGVIRSAPVTIHVR